MSTRPPTQVPLVSHRHIRQAVLCGHRPCVMPFLLPFADRFCVSACSGSCFGHTQSFGFSPAVLLVGAVLFSSQPVSVLFPAGFAVLLARLAPFSSPSAPNLSGCPRRFSPPAAHGFLPSPTLLLVDTVPFSVPSLPVFSCGMWRFVSHVHGITNAAPRILFHLHSAPSFQQCPVSPMPLGIFPPLHMVTKGYLPSPPSSWQDDSCSTAPTVPCRGTPSGHPKTRARRCASRTAKPQTPGGKRHDHPARSRHSATRKALAHHSSFGEGKAVGGGAGQHRRTVAVRVFAAASLPRSPRSRPDGRGHAPGIAPLGRVAQKQFRHPSASGM